MKNHEKIEKINLQFENFEYLMIEDFTIFY